MQNDAATRLTDGFNDLSYGMDSSRSPEVIAPNAVSYGVNVVFRNGWARTRPSFKRQLAAVDSTETWSTFAAAFFQGAGTYLNPQTGTRRILAVADGRVYSINPARRTITDLTIVGEPINHTEKPHYFCQAEGFLIIQNGVDRALIFDGKKLRRAEKDEVPVGTFMAYGQGRLFVVSSDFSRVYSGDLVFGGSATQQKIIGSDRLVTYKTKNKVEIDETKVRITTQKAHGLKSGDTVTLAGHSSEPSLNGTWNIFEVGDTYFHIPTKLDSPGLGGVVLKANDGKESDLLRFTEQNYLNEKGVFRLPAYLGKITGLSFYAVQDTGTGQGDLLLFGESGIVSLAVSEPRETWLDIPSTRIAVTESGATSPGAIVPVNGDVFYRANDGLRSYRSARAEFSGYGRAPVSAEVNRVLDRDTEYLLDRASAVLFDQRLLVTSGPTQLARTPGTRGVRTVFRSLTVLDFHNTARIVAKGAPAYDGIWTGLNFQKLLTLNVDGKARCFAFTHNTETAQTELWELTKDQTNGADISDTRSGASITRNSTPIQAVIETRALSFASQFQMKKLFRGDLWLADLLGNTRIRAFFRPDAHPYWFRWQSFETNVEACGGTVGCGSPPVAKLPAISPQITLGTPPDHQDPDVLVRRVDRGFTFQLRLEWQGRLTLQKCVLYADSIVEQVSGPCPNVLPRTVKKCPDSPGTSDPGNHSST